MGAITRTISNNLTTDLGGVGGVNFRNLLINGDMSLAQRAASKASISSGNTTHTCDQWKTYINSAGTWTQTQESLTSGEAYENGFIKSLKMDCTTANGSLSAGSFLIVAQSIEAQFCQTIRKGSPGAKQLTASFWVKSTKTGTNIVQFVGLDNTVRIVAKSYTINASNTWEKKTLTIPADTDTNGKIANDNGEGLRMLFWVAAGSNYTSGTLATTWGTNTDANRAVGQINNADSTSNNFEITGVQLETGPSASDFEFLPPDVHLERCQRYFQHHIKNPNEAYTGGFRSATSVQMGVQMFTQMRGQPTATYQGLNCHDLADGQNLDASAISFGAVSGTYESAVWCIVTCDSGGSNGDVSIVYGKDTESTGILGFFMDASF